MQINCSRFSGEYTGLNGEQTLNISLLRLYHSAITVGAPSWRAALPTSWQAIHFAFHKISAIASVIEMNNNEITLPENYENLDPQEKRVLSFWTGMIIAKLVAGQLLDIPWLCHAYGLKRDRRLRTDPQDTQSLPDFVGQDRRYRWHIIEAKCNQDSADLTVKDDPEKDQTRRIVTIDNQAPVTRTYCFTILRPEYHIILIDPIEGLNEGGVKYIINSHELQNYYYRPVFEIFQDEKSSDIEVSNGILYRHLGFDPNKQKISIGIVKDVFSSLQKGKIIEAIESKSAENEFIGTDGIAFRIEPAE